MSVETRKRRNVRRFTVELSPEEYELLEYLTQVFEIPKAKIVRNALRHYFSYTILSLYAPELKGLLDLVRERVKRSG
jgi:hypothetical protein